MKSEKSKNTQYYEFSNELRHIKKNITDNYFDDIFFNSIKIELFLEIYNDEGVDLVYTNWKKLIYSEIRYFFHLLKSLFLYLYKNFKVSVKLKPIKSKIIFFPTEPNHVNQMLPVFSYLKSKGYNPLWVVFNLDIAKILNKNNIKPFFSYLAWPIIFLKYLVIKIKSLRINKRSSNTPVKKININNVLELIIQSPKRYLYRYYITKYCFEKIYHQIKPSLFFIGYDLTIEGRALALNAKEKKIISTSIMHGLLGRPEDSDHIVDHFFVYGEIYKNILINAGINEDNLEVTGSPFFDKYYKNGKLVIHHDSSFKEILSIPNEKKIILIATSGAGHSISLKNHLLIIKSIINASEKFKQCHFVFKLHKKDNIKYYKEILDLKIYNNINIIDFYDERFPLDIFYWIKDASLVITSASTIILETLVLDKIPFTLDYYDELVDHQIINEKFTIHCKTPGELFQNIEKHLEGKSQSADMLNLKNSHLGYLDGRSSKRVGDRVIAKLK